MMFQEFTWQHFLIAALVFCVVWWIVVLLLYWREEISGLLSGKGWNPSGRRVDDAEPLPHGWQDQVNELSGVNVLDDGLMGKPVLEHGVSVLDADEFSFAPVEERGAHGEPDALGELADVQQEVKSICGILEKEDGSKEDFFSLFVLVKSKYPRVAASELLPQINDFIREHVPFYLSDEELDSLWV